MHVSHALWRTQSFFGCVTLLESQGKSEASSWGKWISFAFLPPWLPGNQTPSFMRMQSQCHRALTTFRQMNLGGPVPCQIALLQFSRKETQLP